MADQAIIDKLANQILGQGVSSQWKGQGHGSAAANARDMATIMAGIGITDISQFGKVPQYEPVQEIGQFYNGRYVATQDNGDGTTTKVISVPSGQYDSEGNEYTKAVEVPKGAQLQTVYGKDNGMGELEAVDQSKITIRDGKPVIAYGETFGNKITGTAVPNTYSERQTGNAWGGTFAGDGNTGYRVQFTANGTPIFYTTYASSNDLANFLADLGPIGQIGLAIATGGLSIPQQIAAQLAIQVLSGQDLETAIKNAAVSFAAAQIPGTDIMKDVSGFITDLGLPASVTTTLNNAVQTAAVTGAKAVLTGQDLSDAITRGFTSGGINGAVNALLPNIDGFKDLNNTQKRLVTNAVTGFVSGKPLDQILINTAIAAATQQVSDQKRLNAPLDDQAISELSAEEKAVYDESGTQGLKAYLDALKIKNTEGGGTSGTGTDTVTVTGSNGCLANEYWDPVLKSCQTKQVDTSTGTSTGTGTVVVAACGEGKVRNAAGICVPIDCGDGKYWDPITKQCELKKVDTTDTGTGTSTGTGTVTVTACGEGKVRNAAGECVPINCGEGKYWDPVTKQCELKKVDTVDTGTGTGTVTVTACGEGKVRNAAGECVPIDCGSGKYWDPVTKQCELKKVDTVTTTLTCGANEEKSPDGKSCIPKCGTGFKRGADGITCVKDDAVVITACGEGKVRNAAGECVPIDCGNGKYWDPVTKQCELTKVTALVCGANEEKSPDGLSCLPKCGPGYTRGPDGITCAKDEAVVITACGEGKVRNAAGICVPIDCGEGKYWDPITKQCEVKKIDTVVTTLTCGANEEKSPDGLSCLPKCSPGYKRGPDGITCVKDDEVVITSCGEGKVRNAEGKCVPIDCGEGKYWDPVTKQCELKKVECDAGFHDDGTGFCVADDDESCKPGFEPVNGSCVPVCKEGYIRNLATGVCEIAEKTCPAGQIKNAAGVCVPITATPVTCPPGQTKNAAGVCVPTTTTTTTPAITPAISSTAVSTETTSPIYAGPMGPFDLFATLPELLADDTDKEDKKKTTRQTQQTTKMATGGLLDDLLAEQMTVDDLLNLLR